MQKDNKMKYKIAFIVLGVAVLAAVVLAFIIQKERQDCSGSVCTSNLKINTNYATPSTSATATSSATVSAVPSTTASPDLIYRNSTYGFQITLSEAWKGYQIETSASPQGAEAEIDFVMPSTTKAVPLKIFVYKLVNWDSADVATRGTGVARNSTYVFSYRTWDSPPTDLVQITDKEIADRLATFKLL